jgi:hypothetical protein
MFPSNHADGIAAVDLFVLPTIAFRILYYLVIIRHGRRAWVSFGVTENRDCGVGLAPDHRGFSMGPSAAIPHSGLGHLVRADLCAAPACHGHSRSADSVPITLANAYVVRFIGSIRREFLDHMIVFSEGHLHRILGAYAA